MLLSFGDALGEMRGELDVGGCCGTWESVLSFHCPVQTGFANGRTHFFKSVFWSSSIKTLHLVFQIAQFSMNADRLVHEPQHGSILTQTNIYDLSSRGHGPASIFTGPQHRSRADCTGSVRHVSELRGRHGRRQAIQRRTDSVPYRFAPLTREVLRSGAYQTVRC